MYQLLINNIHAYVDRWLVRQGRVVAISILATPITMKSITAFVSRLKRHELTESEKTAGMLYDPNNLADSPGFINFDSWFGPNIFQTVSNLGKVGNKNYQSVFIWNQGTGADYNVIIRDNSGGEENAAKLWHRMVEERSESVIVSIRDWAPAIWAKLKDRQIVDALQGHNLSGFTLRINDRYLQEIICEMVLNKELSGWKVPVIVDQDMDQWDEARMLPGNYPEEWFWEEAETISVMESGVLVLPSAEYQVVE